MGQSVASAIRNIRFEEVRKGRPRAVCVVTSKSGTSRYLFSTLAIVVLSLHFVAGGWSLENSRPEANSASSTAAASTLLAKAVPFELNANKIYVQVHVNNAGPFWFILDSGSVFNVLDKDRAETLAVNIRGGHQVSGAGEGQVEATQTSGISLQLGKIKLDNQDVTVLPLNSSLSGSEGHTVDGLLGFEFIRKYCIEVNYLDRVLNIYEAGSCSHSGSGTVIPIEIENDKIFVPGTLVFINNDQVQGRFMVDTGFRPPLVLNTPFVQNNDLLSRAGRTIPAATGVGLGGQVRGVIGRLTAFQLGELSIKGPVVSFSDMKSGVLTGRNFSGILGGDILRRFNVTFDCSQRQIILAPHKNSDEPFESDMSGLILKAEGKKLDSFRVLRVLDQSPASEAGIQADDMVEGVDGHPASHLTLERISQLFKHGAGRSHRLLLKRGQSKVTATIKLRRLI